LVGWTRDEAEIAVVAGLVDIEKRDDVTFLDRMPFDVGHFPADRLDDAHRHVARNDWERHVELAVVQVDVGSAHL
jgi:hypothetical protein